jgi:site-specific recombinase XerD
VICTRRIVHISRESTADEVVWLAQTAGNGSQCLEQGSESSWHASGYALANKDTDTRSLQAYLGHASITLTVRYTELSPTRFKGIWR